ncbi:hypothetical protein ST37_14115 [Vibrio sp. qd031]|uniref:ATP-binding protein n=1 Tax=Vibrio sp. qd031 TaxID=1603038 RepID=UPI000A10D345|nr:ATP-binding protein [Vibrio sp. qd031]ORT49526.1 hypothetical protein ST37_14115 [Vibrio sp. qd031]
MAKMSVSARAVDMLGRQQIAGIPTAIHELFKNAHDAYAKNAEIDYYENQNLVTLRDDGVGMTESDFIDKWLTIGTSSKYGVNRKSEYIPDGMTERKLMGEKGIGRLAIASIGRQVVALSRAEREGGLHEMIVALIHWTQFEIPDISISDIVIPTRTFPEGELPTENDLKEMSEELLDNLNVLRSRIPHEFFDVIKEDLKLLTFSPEVLFKNLQQKTVENWEEAHKGLPQEDKCKLGPPPVLDGLGRGTHFIIMPCDESLELDVKTDEKGTTELQKILVGFSNSLSTNESNLLGTKFRRHQGSAKPVELIEEGFFTQTDASDGDHFVSGKFDEFGQFSGAVTVYKGEEQQHIINWNESFGSKTKCGPFSIKFTYLQGEPSESFVPPKTYADINNKLKMYGGLYLYKDGIRVLPYGKPEFDFLKFEERRTKRASDNFFSYRLMFGAIEIEHDVNKNLVEKAGREGLIENIAYREFKSILINFFKQLAVDFFRENSTNDRFAEIKNDFRVQAAQEKEILNRRKKQVGLRKKNFEKDLTNFFDLLKDDYFTKQIQSLESYVEISLTKTDDKWPERKKYTFINELKSEVSDKWKIINKSLKITKPNIGINKNLRSDWEAYLRNKEKLNAELVEPIRFSIEKLISEYVSENGLSFSLRERVNVLLEQERKSLTKNISLYRDELKNNVGEIELAIKDKARAKSIEYTQELSKIITSVNSVDIDAISDEESMELISGWEKMLEEVSSQTEQYFIKMRDTVELVINDINNEDASSIDILTALENENEQVKESLNKYFEFAQLGMSLGIIQHEFSSTARSVRSSIKSLKPWADRNPKLGDLYKNISHSFSHLDGYLKMFTPLNRRLYRSKVDLSGKEIEAYLLDIFNDRLERHSIKLKVSDEFRAKKTHVFPSSFLPVFINVVDNAIYWLNRQPESENRNKFINLDVENDELIISNNGPEISVIDEERIFEFTFSRKLDGRGMGLYISKETLNNEGFDIQLSSNRSGDPVSFIISKLKQENE